MPPALTYCTVDQFTDESTFAVDDEALLTKVIARAERQLDNDLLSGWGPPIEATGLRIDPEVDLDGPQRDGLVRAVVAQTEYRLTMGEEFFRANEPESISGPDYSRSGRLGKIAGQALSELRGCGLLTQWARGSGGSR